MLMVRTALTNALQNQGPVLKSVRRFAKIINLSLVNFSLPVSRVTFIFLGFFVSEKCYRSSYIKEFSLERFTVSLTEICLYETVNNESNIRGECRGLPLLPMQHPEMAAINIQS